MGALISIILIVVAIVYINKWAKKKNAAAAAAPPPPPPPSSALTAAAANTTILNSPVASPFTFNVNEMVLIMFNKELTGSITFNMLDANDNRLMQLGIDIEQTKFNCKINGIWLNAGSCGVTFPNKHVWYTSNNVIKITNTATTYEVFINDTFVYSFKKRLTTPVAALQYDTHSAENPRIILASKYATAA